MIVVTGSTGTNGREIIRQLSEGGHSVRAMVRKRDDRAERLNNERVDVAVGDFGDDASLRTVLEESRAALLLPANSEHQWEQEQRFIDIAKDCGVQRIVKFSAAGADERSESPILNLHGKSEAYLAMSGIEFTHLRPTYFMQNLLQFSESIKREGKFYLPLAGATISMVDVRDIAAVAVASLTSDTHVGKTYEITGPCAIGFEEVAAELELVLGRDIEFVAIPDVSFKEGLLSFGLSEWFADALIQLFVGARDGAQAHVSEAVLQATGQAPRPLAQFLRDHAKSFA